MDASSVRVLMEAFARRQLTDEIVTGYDSNSGVFDIANVVTQAPSMSSTTNNDNNNHHKDGSDNEHDGQEVYEFVLFLLWYLFLVFCCVLPTCCAYRRRRLLEARLTQQQREHQASFDQLREQNLFVISNFHITNHGAFQEDRMRRIAEVVQGTTFVSTIPGTLLGCPVPSPSNLMHPFFYISIYICIVRYANRRSKPRIFP